MTEKSLAVLLAGARVGTLFCDRNLRLRLVYDAVLRKTADAIALSLSLPLVRREHGHDATEAFLWGLLPDNERVLERWATQFHVSARNPFALLAHVGEDCAGAVQIVPEERIATLRPQGPPQVEWLTQSDVARRLAALRADETAWRRAGDAGQFSLAGAQPKTALYFDGRRWGVPIGATPTTHILKPPATGLDGQIEDEHFCLRLARALGLPTAESSVQRFGDEAAIVIERYDRVRLTASAAAAMAAQAAAEAAAAAATGDAEGAASAAAAAARAVGFTELAKQQPVLRLHQEDLCQALGVRPQAKYQNEGGPSPGQIAELLRAASDRAVEDVQTFADALVYNWLIAGTDAHAKNYSLLHGRGGRVRLAPLYDLASALPFPELDPNKLKLAMRLGGHYRVREIGARELRKTGEELGLDPDAFLARSGELCAALVPAIEAVYEECRQNGLDHPILERLAKVLKARARQCVRALRS
jgi:serine/threonine-protein kinase HipA